MKKSSIQIIKIWAGIFLFLLSPGVTQAQVPNTAAGYAFSAYSETYTAMSGGTAVSAIQSDDSKQQGISLGFSFPFAGSTYSTVSVCSNGWISLSNANSSTTSNSTSSATNYGPLMMPLFDDLNGSPNGQAHYQTTGTSPNRVFTMEWKNWRWYYNASGNNVISFQVRLYESGRIEFAYSQGPDAVSGSSPSATIGIAKNGSDYQTLNNTSSSPTSSSSTFTTNLNSKPATGQVYSWDAPCSPITGLASSNVTANSATLSWNSVSGALGYEYVLDQSSGNPSGSGTFTSSASYNASGLTQTTTYYMHVRTKCGSSSFSTWVTTSFTTLTSCYPTTQISVSNMTASGGTLNWSAVSGTNGYEYVINQSSGNPGGNGTFVSGTSTPFSGLTANTSYYAHVRHVCDATDKSIWTHYQFTTPSCERPTNVLVSNITDTSADILWSLMANGTKYQYAIDFSNQPPTTGIQSTTAITAHAGGLIPNSKYYIHIRSNCFVHDSSDWRLDSFITKSTCYAPNVQVNNLGTNTPDAYWDPVPSALGYEYALRNNTSVPAFGNTIYTTSVSLTLPADGLDYYLAVRSKCNSMFTFSNWTIVELRTGTTGINGPQQASAPEIYPNPARSVLYVRAQSAGSSYSVTDITGRVLLNGTLLSPITEINTASLSSGLYLVKFNMQGKQVQLKFVKE